MSQLREERQAELRRAFEEHQARMREINGTATSGSDSDSNSDDGGEEEAEDKEEQSEWNGIAEPEPVDHTAEYIDEDKYTTVTVEEIDPTRDGFGSDSDSGSESEDGEKEKGDKEGDETTESQLQKNKKKRTWSKDAPDKPKKLKKKRNFKYETKDERRVSRFKERTGNRKRAKERKRK